MKSSALGMFVRTEWQTALTVCNKMYTYLVLALFCLSAALVFRDGTNVTADNSIPAVYLLLLNNTINLVFWFGFL